MNKVQLVGRIASDITMRQTQNGNSNCSFRIAVQRRFKNSEGKYDSDFIQISAWRQTAEFINKFFAKGDMIGLSGSITTRSYDAQDGSKRYVVEVLADEAEFVGSKRGQETTTAAHKEAPKQMNFEEISDDDLPF